MRPSLRFPEYKYSMTDTVHHVLSLGQSLAVGVSSDTTTLSTTQPYSNLMFADGVAITDLIEPCYRNQPNGNDNSVETIHSGMANLWSELANGGDPDSHIVLNTATGYGGVAIGSIEKGGAKRVYEFGIANVLAAMRICRGTYAVDAVCLIHGENDHSDANASYDTDVAGLQSDYDTDIKAITGQASDVALFQCQMSSWTYYSDTTSIIPGLQWDAAKDNADVYLVCPKYMLEYDTSGLHLTPAGYRRLGEYYAKAIDAVVTDSGTWTPLQPATCTRVGAVVTLTFDIPVGNLVLDTGHVSNPGDYGFEWFDNGDGNSVSISSVALASGDTEVDITLSDTPTGTGQQVRYAYTGIAGNHGGPTTGPRGNLRDQDTSATSRHGYSLYNWCIHFAMDVS